MKRPKPRQDLLALLCTITDPEVMNAALETMLSRRELEDIENRLQIFRLLLDKTPQREIATTLKVGIATVTRGAATVKDANFAQLAKLLTELDEDKERPANAGDQL